MVRRYERLIASIYQAKRARRRAATPRRSHRSRIMCSPNGSRRLAHEA